MSAVAQAPARPGESGLPGSELAIETHGLTKRFGSQLAVAGIDLAVPRGSVFGFLGPNGSGKTTTIRMLLGLARASAGEMRMLGRPMPTDLAHVLPAVGALIEGPGFTPFLSGRANLLRFDAADGWAPRRTRRARVDRALERVGLTQAAGKRARAYSLGMKQRLGIANALLMPRDLIVLDEPTNGLDPQGTREVRSLIRSLAAEGTTVFVSSHLLAEIEQMCTHAAVMSAGAIVAQGSLDELRAGGESRAVLTTRVSDADTAAAVLRRLLHRDDDSEVEIEVRAGEERIVSAVLAADVPPELIVRELVEAGVAVLGFAVQKSSLEDRFVALTGEGFDVVR
ncbi:ATP-binding cassette domain-containing protein [Cnuibacter physcomitrellae]|uniref:ABC transporter ATP-binding protein n=1 Tax=Cnuibacter physcomitrellae TaxID=1619308 RepID=UPI00217580B7|nr:ATP-binding cassette domain-containing protein [Cnuibacter physcomitrellae]MCS5495775.1 ATP-binding cassette domain-containing protein [Cnuibacter physcomitrellae]